MLAQLGVKDYIGPIVSIVAAILSFVYFWRGFRLSKRMTDRSLNLEAQKMLLEINRQLISDPWLWSIYDDHPVRSDSEFESKCGQSRLFQAKLQAFAYLCLNMFEVVLAEAPEPEQQGHRNASNHWVDFFRHAVSRSTVVREILEASEARQLYDPVLIALYTEWQRSAVAEIESSAAPEE